MRLLRIIGGAKFILCAALLASSAIANEDLSVSVEDYDQLTRRFDELAVLAFHGGIGDGLVASRESYRGYGEPPLFCVTDDKRLSDMALRESILKELEADGHTWRRVSTATIDTIVLHVLRRDYPCGNVRSKAAAPNRMMSGYVVARDDIKTRSTFEILYFYYVGLRAAIIASGDAYAARGAKRRICFPAKLEFLDLIKVADAELERNSAMWLARPYDNFGMLAFKAFEQQFPCK